MSTWKKSASALAASAVLVLLMLGSVRPAHASAVCSGNTQPFVAGSWRGSGTAGGPTNKLTFTMRVSSSGTVTGAWTINAKTGQTISGTVSGSRARGIKTRDKTGSYSYTMRALTGCGGTTVTGELVDASPGALTPVIWTASKT